MKPRNEPLAFHLCGVEVRRVEARRGAGRSLPRTLVIPPGIYRVHGRNYRLRDEGLYRFLFPGKSNYQRIVYRRDVRALLSGLSWISTHGSLDNLKPHSELRRLALTQKLIVTCGKIAEFGRQMLERVGIRARLARTKTLQTLNTYDTGHVLLEVHLDGKWTLVDLDCNRMFRRNGKRLSLLECTEAVAVNDFQLELLSAATATSIGGFTEDGYDYGMFMETTLGTEAWIRHWYRRILMVPIFRADGLVYVLADGSERRRKIEQAYPEMKSRFLSRREFVQKFY